MRTGLPGFLDHITLQSPHPSSLFTSFHKHLSSHIEHGWSRCCTRLGRMQWQPWEKGICSCVWIQNGLLQAVCCLAVMLLLSVMSSVISCQAYQPASPLALKVVSGLGSISWPSRGGGGDCSGKGVLWGHRGVILQLVWRCAFMFPFAYGGRNRVSFIFLRLLPSLRPDCKLSNQAKNQTLELDHS